MKNRINYQISLWTYVFIGLLSLLAMQCSCSPRFSSEGEPSSKQQESEEPQESQEPSKPQESPVPPLNPITNEMIEAAEKARKHFLAEQLRKLQKEDPTKHNISYINDQDHLGITALYEVADTQFKRPDIMRVLLERRANPNVENHASDTPLGAAASSTPQHNLEIIRLLLDAGADPFGGKAGFGPMYSVISSSYEDISAVKLMLSKIPNINIQDVNGDTVLHYAVRLGKKEAIALLLEKGAKPDISNNNATYSTPKDLAKLKNKEIRVLFGLL